MCGTDSFLCCATNCHGLPLTLSQATVLRLCVVCLCVCVCGGAVIITWYWISCMEWLPNGWRLEGVQPSFPARKPQSVSSTSASPGSMRAPAYGWRLPISWTPAWCRCPASEPQMGFLTMVGGCSLGVWFKPERLSKCEDFKVKPFTPLSRFSGLLLRIGRVSLSLCFASSLPPCCAHGCG